MKANDIRSIAKAIRTGKLDRSQEWLEAFLLEAFEYVEENKAGWKEKFTASIEDALDVIQEAVEAEASDEAIEAVEETASAEEVTTKRCNFKTVLRRFADEGAEDPVLDTIRWFATVYARDEYRMAKTIRGMISRRGYTVDGSDDEFTVSRDGRLLARVKAVSGVVEAFEMEAA